ncbi:MAG: tRNA pseudouridine(38-40) synthase TruA [Alphaproteobacteria bacterium]
MPRYKIILEYDGTPFVGWQRQNNGVSVQGVVEAAILSFSGEAVTITAAGRTDTGVHARGQVASFDLARSFPADTVRDAINALVRPHPVAVLSASEVASDFGARFSAIKRHYEYRVITRRAPLVLDRDRAWWIPQILDAAAMAEAAHVLIGQHDFTTFRAAECQAKSPVKTLDEAHVEPLGESIYFNFSARSFLHSQVRSMVGSLIQVGRGKWSASDLRTALQSRDRAECGPLAPPCGLTLMRVDYA